MNYTIAPGETRDYTFNFRGASPGPALRTGQNIGTATATVNAGLSVGATSVSGDLLTVRVVCPDSVPLGTRAQVRARVEATGTNSGEVLVDEIELGVSI